MELSSEQLDKLLQQAVNKAITPYIRKDCFTCTHFKFRPPHKTPQGTRGGVRVCQCPDDKYVGKTVDGVCANWTLEPNPTRRVKRFC